MKTRCFAGVLFFLFIVLVCPKISFGQNGNQDDETAALIAEAVGYFNLGNEGATTISSEKFAIVLELCRKRQIKQCEAVALKYSGQIFLRQDNPEKAFDSFSQSLALFPQLKNDFQTERLRAENLLGLGVSSLQLKNNEQALKYLSESLAVAIKRNDKPMQAIALSSLGNVYRNLGQRETALEKFQNALAILQAEIVRLPELEILLLWEISAFRADYGDLSYHRKILAIHKQLGDVRNAVMTLNVLYVISAQTGNINTAEEFCDEAVVAAKDANNPYDEAFLLNSIAYNYSNIGEFAKAIEIAEKILPIFQQMNYITGVANVQGFIGGTYLRLGEYSKAIQKYKSSIQFFQSEGCRLSETENMPNSYFCRRGEIAVVTGTAKALSSSGKKSEAVKILEDELKKMESEPEPIAKSQEKGILLNVIGQIYSELNQKDKAIKYYSLALPLINDANVRRKSSLLADTAQAQTSADEQSKAPVLYEQSLLILTPFVENTGRGREEAVGYTLDSLMSYHKSKNPKFAVLFGKKAIESYGLVRKKIQTFDKETQKAFLKSIENSYRLLAEILFEQNRVDEALQVLNAFKDQQFFDFEFSKQIAPLSLTARETEFAARFVKANEEIAALDLQSENLKNLIGNRPPNTAETNRLNDLKALSKTAANEFLAVLRQAEAEFSKPADEKDKIPKTADLCEMQATLREISQQTEQPTAAVYQLVGRENFHSLVITSDDIKSVSTPIKNADLQKRALEFWALLQSPIYDPNKLGLELYNAIFQPLEAKLPKDTKTIMWSLDGNLRYVPMAALYDGNHYLVERYNHVNFTRPDKERITRAVSPKWTGTGFGTSQAKTVVLSDEQINFTALPGVTAELNEIFKTGVMTGDVLPNEQFTRTNMLAALKKKRPLVHIASHFAFRPGDESRSFLLMGDGKPFTLAEMKTNAEMFAGVELLTLSACNTAAQRADASGREVDAFAELAQRLGAGAVMATLWAVADSSTPWLMRDFYTNRQSKNLNKAASLRQAQLALLNGTAETKPLPETQKGAPTVEIIVVPTGDNQTRDTTRAEEVYIDEKDALPFKKIPGKPFAHPYYWSPFVLIGNWR